jgi:uncharacterized protein (DUF1501 family)
MTMLDRRDFLLGAAQLTLLAPCSALVRAAPRPEARFVLVILRGGLDGLAAAPPYGAHEYAGLRGDIALAPPGAPDGVLKLDGLFGLHPSLSYMHTLYERSELALLHAVATPYRERSHFDGQKVLEAGGVAPSTSEGGWLNRALAALAGQGDSRKAVALGPSVPLVLRGPFTVASWAPSRLPGADDDTLARVRALYEASDPVLAARLSEALVARDLAGEAAAGRPGAGRGQALRPLTTAAGRFLSDADGPRIAVIDIGGWDTHANQGAAQGNLALRLRGLDDGLHGLADALGPIWRSTSVLIVTEFGRTAAVNGTRGTDHGTAGCALLAGGAVAGGRVIADWPGLRPHDLHEGRDLRPTLDLRAVVKGLLTEQFGLPEPVLASAVFPDSAGVAPLPGLLRA